MRAARQRHDPEREREETIARSDGCTPDADALLALQRGAGNQAVTRLLGRAVGPMRPRRTAAGGRVKPPRYLGGQDEALFGPSSKSDGGSSATVVIGPSGGDPVNYGSKPAPGECTAVEKLNADDAYLGSDTWIKGHLQNDNLGGPGVRANLTPMTDAANKQHAKSFEGPVKRAIVRCQLLGNPEYSPIKGEPAFDYWYGVDYDVRVDGTQVYPGGPAHAQAVNANLDCNATYVKQEKGKTDTEPLDDEDIEELELPDLPPPGHQSPCT